MTRPQNPDRGQPWLVADIGGTNARFGWVDGREGGAITRVSTLPTAEHADIAAAVRAYLAQVASELGGRWQPPQRAAFAVATAVAGDWIEFTNSSWQFSARQLQLDLRLRSLQVLNDFEALALALPRLSAGQYRAHERVPDATGTLAVVGPGTGLGVAGVTRARDGSWVALAGEGGHCTLSAFNDFESALLQHVRSEFEHVSAERLLSGIGMPVLHRAVARVMGCTAGTLTTEQIVEAGLARTDDVCDRTLDAFCALLGGFCGNVVLTLGARGGLFIGGGIVPRLGERFFSSSFRDRFEAKGRFSGYLQAVPSAVIVDTMVALDGAVAAIERLAE